MLSAVKSLVSIFTTVTILFFNICGFTGYKGTDHVDYRTYKNVILMIGDGMGFNTIAATKKLKNTGVAMDNMPVLCESNTRSITNEVTDSAAGGTALATGTRTYNGAIGVYLLNPLGNFIDVPKNLCELAKENGKSAGVVTTDKTSGATPASFSSHSVGRGFEFDISIDQMTSDLDLIWGAESDTVSEWMCDINGFDLISSTEEMNALKPGSRSFGQFKFNDFATVSHDNGTPYISEMTTKAIELLNANENGFFLMVEGAQIDKFSHSQNFDGSTTQLVEFSKAVQVALDFAKADGDTLVLVTADHETGGIQYNSESDEYYYTKGSHTGVNVPAYVSAIDAGFISGEVYKNCEISTQLARVMGFDKSQFPALKG
ncbi:MAG: alkaline phosphatase [Ruminococcus sp.]|nr:alkaline phosphatase [Candidatus Copronaster equi]